ncbi:hypothetical protein Bhyg_17061 [Pseudolycoriella hygida]|uniref:Uncharacterized protein n=1 Tax=Pseudolycoriella hygida TaxID=35572 RepID=A0A9Q0MK42_9DIPT|nr:hypothetical protein Bhyg_17061 [Pseudolycoriella hygida]
MKLAVSCLAFWMLISTESVLCASLKEAEKSIVKRNADLLQIPSVFRGGLDTAMDMLGRFGSGLSGSSMGNTDTMGFDDETVSGGASQSRKKRSPKPCGRNATNSATGRNNGPNRRSTGNPDVETLARRKRSPQSNPPNGPPPSGFPPNGPPPNGPPPNGPPPNGFPPNGPPPNCTRPDGGLQNRALPEDNQRTRRDAQDDGDDGDYDDDYDYSPESGNSGTTQARRKRSPKPCGRNLTASAARNVRSASNPDFVTFTRRKRSAQTSSSPTNRPPNGSPPNGPPPNGPPPNGPPPNFNGNIQNTAKTEESQTAVRSKRSAKPCNGPPNGNIGSATNSFPSQSLPQQTQPPPNNGVNIADLQRDQNQRTRRAVDDPDRVIPSSSVDDKNLFDRIMEVAKEIASRIKNWTESMDNQNTAGAATRMPPK